MVAISNQDLLGSLEQARAIRVFDVSRPISDEDWSALLEVVRQSPSSNGLENWRLLQVDDPALREQLAAVAAGMGRQLASAPKVVFFIGLRPTESLKAHLAKDIHGYDDAAYATFHEHFGLLQDRLLAIDESAWVERQVAIPAARLMLAANLLGIDNCPMEGYSAAAVASILQQAGLFDPQSEQLGIAVALGYRAAEPPFPSTRRPLDEILTVA